MRFLVLSAVCASMAISTPASAQSDDVDKRVERLEQEMRAVQRKVFPGGSPRFFEPDIGPEENGSSTPPSVSTSAVTDLIARVDALERSLAQLTGQVEQNGFRLKQIEDQLAAQATVQEEVVTSEAAPAATATDNAAAATSSNAAETPDPDRVQAVAAVVKPDTGDAGEDAYIYGYRLWDAKFYPEAQTQLKKAFTDHPNHRRASFAQNLLGRAYLDDGKPALASVALYENYQKRPRGERAPDSLYFLSRALVQLDKKDDACRVLAELQDVYPAVAGGRLKNRVDSGKAAANCR